MWTFFIDGTGEQFLLFLFLVIFIGVEVEGRGRHLGWGWVGRGAECLVQFSTKLSNRQCFQRYNKIKNKQTNKTKTKTKT